MHTYSVVSDSCDLQIVAHQAPLSMGFSKQEYWSSLPFLASKDQIQVFCIIFIDSFKRTHLLEARIEVEKQGRRPLLWAVKKMQVANDPICDVFRSRDNRVC